MNREAELEISGVDWLCLKLMPEDGVRLESEADLNEWKAADWERIAGRCRNGHDWYELLMFYPQLADRCDWTKFGGDEWSCYLCCHPELFDKCNCALIDKYYWELLLRIQPQFAEKCDWKKLKKEDWERLLLSQPHHRNKCPFLT